ncbi:hypothetical protein KIPB_005593, partial [Kipferlia bialata]
FICTSHVAKFFR